MALAMVTISVNLYAQNKITVNGSVQDSNGEALIGVTVLEKGSPQNAVPSDFNGNFSLTVGSNSTLVFSYLGYGTQEVSVNGRTNIRIVLEEDAIGLNEVVVIGYGVKAKETLTGAVSAVTGTEISTTKNVSVENMLTGKLPGIRVFQKTAEPGAFDGNFDIRGFGEPLFVIDGIISDRTNFQRLDASDIESISILKDASASIYGVRAANGVLLVTTNKGSNTDGKMTLNYSGRMGWQFPTGSPKSTSAADWMTLRNERVMRSASADNTPPYSQAQIQEYLDGTKQGYDWWDLVMRKATPEIQHNVSVSGGNSKVTYFMSGGYNSSESFLRSKDYNYNRYNVRSNITANVTNRLKVSLNLSGMMDERNRGTEDASWIIRAMQRNPAIMEPYANDNTKYLYYGLIEGDNPIAMSNASISGYRKNKIKTFMGRTNVTYDVPGIKGLTAGAMFSYTYRMDENTTYRREYELYRYDEASQTYNLYARRNSPNRIQRQFFSKPQTLYNFSLDYKNKFNDAHNIGALLVWEGQRRQSDNFSARREVSIVDLDWLFAGNSANQEATMSTTDTRNNPDFFDKTNQALIGRLEYDYKSKYLLEFAFRYDGASVWDENGRWGLFPSVMAGWRVSEEMFWKNSFLNKIDNFKLRASYGEMGDDSSASGYTFYSGWNYPANGGSNSNTLGNNRLPAGYYFDGSYYPSVNNRGLTNPDITWVIAKITNLGVDADMMGGKLGATFEYFRRDRTGILATRTGSIPATLGASMPQENLNGQRNWGYELELRHRNKIGDVRYGLAGMVSYTRQMNLHRDMATPGSYWDNYRTLNNINRYQGVHRGRREDGRFQSYNQIANSLVYYSRSTLPGDYIYQDWNGDGRITDEDEQIYCFEQNTTAPMYYSLNMDVNWKGFDLAMLWQGAAFSYVRYEEQLVEPMWGNDMSNALEFFLDRWHPTEVGVNPFEHTTQWIPGKFAATGAWPNSGSEHNMYNTTYLRLKTIELGYTIPARITRKAGIQNVRVYVNAYNPLTIKNKKLVTDPEHTSDSWGNAYPLAKTFSFGLNLKF